MKTIQRDLVPVYLQDLNGKVFSAVFEKQDGSDRLINCRTGVRKGVKSTGRVFLPSDHGLMSVYDMQKRGFRMINLDTLSLLKVNGQYYRVVD